MSNKRFLCEQLHEIAKHLIEANQALWHQGGGKPYIAGFHVSSAMERVFGLLISLECKQVIQKSGGVKGG